MNRSQRMGLGLVALFYGELVAVPLFMLVVLLRFHSNWYMLANMPRFTIVYLFTVSTFEGLMAAITWCIFGSALVAFWPADSMRRSLALAYAAALPLAVLAPSVLGTLLALGHRQNAKVPLIGRVLFIETAGFMLVTSLVAINRYLKLERQAETVLASTGEAPR